MQPQVGRIANFMRLTVKTTWGWLPCFLVASAPAWGAQPLAIYVADLDTNIAGEHRSLAQDLSNAIETALSRRPKSFRLLERRKFNDVIRRQKLEKDVRALVNGGSASSELASQLPGADGVISGELKNNQLGEVMLTISLTKMDSEKIWQARRKHTLYQWLDSDVQDREAESLAADAAAKLLPEAQVIPQGEDGPRGIELAKSGKCPEALSFLRNATAVDFTNAEVFFYMGRCQNQAGDYLEAAQTLTSAIARNPRRADLFLERAGSFLGQMLYSRALEDIDQAARVDRNNMQAVELRGDVLMKLGKYDESVSAYYVVYQQDPTRVTCLKLTEAYRKNGASGAAATLEKTCTTLR